VALAKRLRGEAGTVYCLLSDGECQEGSIWEAVIFAQHRRLANLVVLVDANGLQGFGLTSEIASMQNLAMRFEGFDAHVQEIDGHAAEALDKALTLRGEHPCYILLRTIKGRGVSFMENRVEWHYLPMTEAQHALAQAEISDA
jgi:transketolase